ncbi:hypothetical protein H9X96_17435 [Pedobacter sp. N36a]|uniref:hypothetical protein n=1 Tax=Pedobacter sp. N36a TaxID=2767996 RepID=UPI0016571C55|nr:hypothetical protein [Pedobacter sp. N36a]MBC8987555.1 hypothetical protein [Pedobacter sp. N36a]
MKYSLSDVITAIDDANKLLSMGNSDTEIIYDVAYGMVRIQTSLKSKWNINTVVEYKTVDEAFYFLQGLNTAAMVQLERKNGLIDSKEVPMVNLDSSASYKIISKVKNWFK